MGKKFSSRKLFVVQSNKIATQYLQGKSGNLLLGSKIVFQLKKTTQEQLLNDNFEDDFYQIHTANQSMRSSMRLDNWVFIRENIEMPKFRKKVAGCQKIQRGSRKKKTVFSIIKNFKRFYQSIKIFVK